MEPAGWYPDPTQTHELRYWDGDKWTEHVANRGQQSVSPMAPAPPDAGLQVHQAAASSAAFGNDAPQARTDGWRALPSGVRWGIGVALVVAVLSALGAAVKKEDSGTTGGLKSGPIVDANTVFNSVSLKFIAAYRAATGENSGSERAHLSNASAKHCDRQDDGKYRCDIGVDVAVVSDPHWHYDVTVTPATGCWAATANPRYGAYQDDVDAYRNRSFLAPSRSEARRLVRRANKLRSLDGCVSAESREYAGVGDGTDFIAVLSKQYVAMHFDGAVDYASCRSRGKDTLGPDSYGFQCAVVMENGKEYRDRVTCFDAPPYTNYESCGEDSGYPKVPPRSL